MIIGGLAILLVAAVATVMILCFSGDGNGRKSRQSETASTEEMASTADDARQTETASTADASEQRADVDPRNEKQNDSQGSSDGLAIGDPGSGEWITGENGEQQFREPTGEIRKNQLFRYDGSIYYVDVTGKKITGVYTIADRLRLFDEEGRMVEEPGWKKIDGKRYYVNGQAAVLAGGKHKVKNKQYYFDSEGVMQTGWIDIGGHIFYYTGSDGVILSDRDFTVKDIWYHAEKDGTVYVGTQYEKAQGYRSDTDYLILLNLDTQTTSVYKGSQGKWKLLREMIVSTGLPINPTPKGEYRTTTHCLKFNNYGVRAWYATGFIGGLYLFHSSPYVIDSEPKVCTDPRLGYPTSHGCVRMALEDAKWMYDNLPLSTKVIIYEDESQ